MYRIEYLKNGRPCFVTCNDIEITKMVSRLLACDASVSIIAVWWIV